MKKADIKRSIKGGKAIVNARLDSDSQQGIRSYINHKLSGTSITNGERQFYKIMIEMIDKKEIDSLNVNLQFVYEPAAIITNKKI